MTYTYTITEYVAGFMFSKDFEFVALIRKNRPEWQKGKYNGIGGHVEPGELPKEAMVREFKEEAGVLEEDWIHYCSLKGPFGYVHFYKATGDLRKLQTMTDEPIHVFPVKHFHKAGVIPNLKWLIPMALNGDVQIAYVEWKDQNAPEGGW